MAIGNHDEWLTKKALSNAPEVMDNWRMQGDKVKEEAGTQAARC